jgi:hypothetical protein
MSGLFKIGVPPAKGCEAKCPSLNAGVGGVGVHEFTRTFQGTKRSYCKKCGCDFPKNPTGRGGSTRRRRMA